MPTVSRDDLRRVHERMDAQNEAIGEMKGSIVELSTEIKTLFPFLATEKYVDNKLSQQRENCDITGKIQRAITKQRKSIAPPAPSAVDKKTLAAIGSGIGIALAALFKSVFFSG